MSANEDTIPKGRLRKKSMRRSNRSDIQARKDRNADGWRKSSVALKEQTPQLPKTIEKSEADGHNRDGLSVDANVAPLPTTSRRSSDDKPTSDVDSASSDLVKIPRSEFQALENLKRGADGLSLSFKRLSEIAAGESDLLHIAVKVKGDKVLRIRPEPSMGELLDRLGGENVNEFIALIAVEVFSRKSIAFNPVQLKRSRYPESKRPDFNPNLPQTIYDKICKLEKETDVSKTSILIQAIGHYLAPSKEYDYMPSPMS